MQSQQLEIKISELEKKLAVKNRELEIEAGLEKVRTIALGMKEPVDMLDVCKTISLQLKSLGVKEIRNVQTAIFYEHLGTYMNYEYYAKHNKTFITETSYTNHEMHKEFAAKMLQGKGEFFVTHIKGKEVKDWIAYQKTTNVFIDKYLETASSVNYYWFSLGPVALGISTYHPLTEDEINLFKRFLKVFELAYRRYLDIENAKAQAREAKIETSLEKVRAAAMSMHKSEDLLNVSEILYEELHKLGFDEMRNAMINIHNDENKTFFNYDYSDEIGRSITLLNFNAHPVMEKQIKQSRIANDAFSEAVYEGKDLEEWKEFRRKYGEKNDPRIDKIKVLYYYFYSIGSGTIGISTFSKINEEKLELLKRFRNVFSLSYRRYSDIALAEAQAREAQIELALERVRARSMAMHKSGELLDVIATVSEQLENLGFKFDIVSFAANNQKYDYSFWMTVKGQSHPYRIHVPYINNPMFENVKQAQLKGDTFYTDILTREENKQWHRHLFEHNRLDFITDKLKKYVYNRGYARSIVLLSKIMLIVGNYSSIPYSDEENNIIKRFANVFDQVYTRFLDLQKAEAQAREAQIEASLEKVRSSAMAMHNSNDISSTTTVVFEELRRLNIQSKRCGVALLSKNSYTGHVYAATTSSDGKLQTLRRSIEMTQHQSQKHQYESWKKQENYVVEMSGEELKSYYQLPFFYSSPNYIPPVNYDRTEYGYYIPFSEGLFYAWTEEPYSESEINILNRFKKIVDLTFRRYFDLQKAEAQAREAQIELALERVRARTMAMQKSEELNDVVMTLFDQMKNLEIDIDGININILNDDSTGFDSWFTAPGYTKAVCLFTPYFNTPVMNDIFNAVKNKQDLLSKIYPKAEKDAYFSYLYEHSDYKNLPDERKKLILGAEGWCLSVGIANNTGISIHSYTGKTFTEKEHDILKRFAKVFDQTYTRFLDLQKAEAQARESQIELALERVRVSAVAMHNSNDVGNATAVMFTELEKLGIETIRCGIDIMDESKIFEVWASTSTDEGKVIQIAGKLDSRIHPHLQRVQEAWERQDKYISSILEGQELEEYYKKLSAAPDYHVSLNKIQYNKQFNYVFFFKEGGLFAYRLKPFAEDEIRILQRFASVFGLTFRRYLDLQKAEVQAREAQIEAALERVRGKAMAMHSSEDFVATIVAFYHELAQLSFTPRRCGVGIIDKETRIAELSTLNTTDKGESIELVGKITLEGHPILENVYKNWLIQNEYHPVLRGDEIKEYYKFLGPQIAVPDYSGDQVQYGYFFYFNEGGVYSWTEKKFSDDELQIYRRFTAVLNLTYRRYLDLKEAEARAIESIRQAALDRIRAEIASMRTSDDLNRITPIIWRELKILGVPFFRCGVYIIDETQEKVQVYLTTPDGKSLGVLNLSFDSNEMTRNTVEHWREKQVYKVHWNKEDFINWAKSMIEIGQIQNVQTYQGSAEPPESLYLNFVPFTQGMLYVGDVSPLTDERLLLVKTLAGAFSIAYARYEDFRQLEEAKGAVESAFGELDILSKELKIKNERLEIENQRRAIELEEARQLQLSMLPKKLPQLPNLQIAAFMRTATEVGGDYYDFLVQDNQELNIGFGDATGHGLQAGTMITLIKGFFTSEAAKLEPQQFLEHCSRMIREIKLGRILMSFSLLRIMDSKLLISSAGMPPVFYYTKSEGETEEILIPGIPLGAMKKSSYKLVEKELRSGDTLLLFTDGFPEQTNSNNEMLNYARAKNHFNNVAENSPDEIIKSLVKKADEWMSGKLQTDDITFIAIKVL